MKHACIAILLATAIGLPCMHLCWVRPIESYRTEAQVSPVGQALLGEQLAIWNDSESRRAELAAMRKRNPEWDFMMRTYLVLALANMALRDSAMVDQACLIIDEITLDTVSYEKQNGHGHFLLSYANAHPWVAPQKRSIFVDGEIALMIAARRMVRDDRQDYAIGHAKRVESMITQMRQSPILCAESYPNECWLFCNTVALAAIRLHDVLDETDHRPFLAAWVERAGANLLDPETGILISAFEVDGQPAPCAFGPEGTTIWMAAHMLQIIDSAFAQDQYNRASRELRRNFLGFGYSREWPEGVTAGIDVDSGPEIPFLKASASASGLAVLGAAAFGDDAYFQQLMTSLNYAGFPQRQEERLRYLAGNPVGDAVLFYAMMEGPLWQKARNR